MYSIGHTFFHALYGTNFKIIRIYENYKMYLCEIVEPNKDEHGMDIKLFTYHSEDYIHNNSYHK